MRRRRVGSFFGILVFILLVGVFGAVLNVPVVRAIGTVYIRADGSIDPPDAPISTVDYVTYALTGNITSDADGIVVERSNITIDGVGYTLQGSGSGYGFYLSHIDNVTIKKININGFYVGVRLLASSHNAVYGSNLMDNKNVGLFLGFSSCNSILDNNIINNGCGDYGGDGIWIGNSSDYNTVSANAITNNGFGSSMTGGDGIEISSSFCNIISGNNLTDNRFDGINVSNSLQNDLSENNITNNGERGVELYWLSNNNTILSNFIENNSYYGISLYDSSNNTIFHNNLIDNSPWQVYFYSGSNNAWDGDYPSGGNYWSDYAGVDLCTGPNQNLTEGIGSDGIGDTNYTIDGNNVDHYPLTIPWINKTPIHPLEGQYANYTVLSVIHGSIVDSLHWNLTYNKYVSPFLIYLETWSSGSSWTDWTWTALNITNRYARHFGWPITGVLADLWFPGLIETDVTIGSTVNFLNGTATVVDSKTLRIESRSLECWELAHDEEIGPSTYIHHSFWFHKTTGLMIGEEVEVNSYQKFNITLVESNILPKEPRTWTVDDDGPADFHTIQEAINAPETLDGHTIFVREGIYYEHIMISKPLKLVGENSSKTIIDGDLVGHVATIVSDGVILDGFTLRNAGSIGVYLESSNCIISGNNVVNSNYTGILLGWDSNNNTIVCNRIANVGDAGIDLRQNFNNTLTGNDVSNGKYGISIYDSDGSGHVICHNSLSDNTWNLYLPASSGIIFYCNNFFKKDNQVLAGYENIWDNGYPSCGNYWSDYNGTDLQSGLYQNDTSCDGIGDTPYTIDPWVYDHYPLMGMFSDFGATSDQHVTTICNSTISGCQFNGTAIMFDVTGVEGTAGFCRICVPTSLMNATYRIFVNGTEVISNLLPCSNSTHNYLYFSYTHSTQEVIVIPEFPSFLILPLFMISTLLAVIVCKKRFPSKQSISIYFFARWPVPKLV